MTKELFLEDAYQRECKAQIIKKDGNAVILDQTVFYPTGGGQEHDKGVLVQGDNVFRVIEVKKIDNQILHILDDSEGIEIGPVTARLDWERRYKLMRHHSLLHVLAAVVYRKFNALDSGNQIYPERARIDFHGLHDLTEQDIADIVEETNRLLDEDHPIYASYVTREEAEKLSNVIKDAVSMLPSTIKRVRLLTIESVETYPCGGTHVKSTREIGKMEIIKVKSRGKGRKRFEVFARDK